MERQERAGNNLSLPSRKYRVEQVSFFFSDFIIHTFYCQVLIQIIIVSFARLLEYIFDSGLVSPKRPVFIGVKFSSLITLKWVIVKTFTLHTGYIRGIATQGWHLDGLLSPSGTWARTFRHSNEKVVAVRYVDLPLTNTGPVLWNPFFLPQSVHRNCTS